MNVIDMKGNASTVLVKIALVTAICIKTTTPDDAYFSISGFRSSLHLDMIAPVLS